jgi:hypothetical protein
MLYQYTVFDSRILRSQIGLKQMIFVTSSMSTVHRTNKQFTKIILGFAYFYSISTVLKMSSFDSSSSTLADATAWKGPTFVMDAFCIRQFNNPSYLGTQVHYDIQQFEDRINEFSNTGNYPLKDGYAPFW